MGCGASTEQVAPQRQGGDAAADAPKGERRKSEEFIAEQMKATGADEPPKVGRSNSITELYTGDKFQQELEALKAAQEPEVQSDDEGCSFTKADVERPRSPTLEEQVAGLEAEAQAAEPSLADQIRADIEAGKRLKEETTIEPSLADQIKADIEAGKRLKEETTIEPSLADQIRADIEAGKRLKEETTIEPSLADQIKADIEAGKAAAAAEAESAAAE